MAAFRMKTYLVLLVIFPLLSLAEVTTFDRCPAFFVNGVSPTILMDNNNNNRYEQICQCLFDNNGNPQYFYATLYDTQNKIPVYSAYILRHAPTERQNPWYFEPQIDGGESLCMGRQNQPDIPNRGQRQALNVDYENSGYDRGHLYPVSHTSTHDAMLATSTLTNAAPQNLNHNRGRWKNHEARMLNLVNICNPVFMVTGVVPDGNVPPINNRVRVAEYYWSAYCCLKGPERESQGYIGPINEDVQNLNVQALENWLGVQFQQAFSLFHEIC